MKKTIGFMAFVSFATNIHAQFNFTPITQLLTDSIGVIGQAGQNCGFLMVQGNSVIYEQYWETGTAIHINPLPQAQKCYPWY